MCLDEFLSGLTIPGTLFYVHLADDGTMYVNGDFLYSLD